MFAGLDLAGPLFYPSLPEWIIDKSDAYFVDLYHSNAGEFGTDRLDGHADFISSLNFLKIPPTLEVKTYLIPKINKFQIISHLWEFILKILDHKFLVNNLIDRIAGSFLIQFLWVPIFLEIS